MIRSLSVRSRWRSCSQARRSRTRVSAADRRVLLGVGRIGRRPPDPGAPWVANSGRATASQTSSQPSITRRLDSPVSRATRTVEIAARIDDDPRLRTKRRRIEASSVAHREIRLRLGQAESRRRSPGSRVAERSPNDAREARDTSARPAAPASRTSARRPRNRRRHPERARRGRRPPMPAPSSACDGRDDRHIAGVEAAVPARSELAELDQAVEQDLRRPGLRGEFARA